MNYTEINNTTIYSSSKTGKILEWLANLNLTPNEEGYLEITITSGQQEGKKVSKIKTVKSGKNIGRANETTLEEQAKLELERLYQTQIDKGYKFNVSDVSITKETNGIPKPMLADKFETKAHKLPEDLKLVVSQPKLDGIRCLITKLEDGSIRFTSRSGKEFEPFEHLVPILEKNLSIGDILDGELYIHGEPLQYIMGLVTRTKNLDVKERSKLEYWFYDFIPNNKADKSYLERYLHSDIYNKSWPLNTKVIPVYIGDFKHIDFESKLDSYLEQGYEGMMLRDVTSPYYFGRRHWSLQKYKRMETDEFKIIDIVDSEQEPGIPRFICKVDEDNEVTCRLKGDKEETKIYLQNKEEYLGQYLTIQYQTKTPTGSLQFPVGICIREGHVENEQFIPNI